MPCFSCSCFKDGRDRRGNRLNGGRGYCCLWDQEYYRGHQCGDYAPTWYSPKSSRSPMEEPGDYSFLDADDEMEYETEAYEEDWDYEDAVFDDQPEETCCEEADEPVTVLQETPVMKGRSKTSALLLAIFLGHMGIDRFYLGYVGMGVLKFLTYGGFGILWLVDIIRIATGALQPADGSGYGKKAGKSG